VTAVLNVLDYTGEINGDKVLIFADPRVPRNVAFFPMLEENGRENNHGGSTKCSSG